MSDEFKEFEILNLEDYRSKSTSLRYEALLLNAGFHRALEQHEGSLSQEEHQYFDGVIRSMVFVNDSDEAWSEHINELINAQIHMENILATKKEMAASGSRYQDDKRQSVTSVKDPEKFEVPALKFFCYFVRGDNRDTVELSISDLVKDSRQMHDKGFSRRKIKVVIFWWSLKTIAPIVWDGFKKVLVATLPGVKLAQDIMARFR